MLSGFGAEFGAAMVFGAVPVCCPLRGQHDRSGFPTSQCGMVANFAWPKVHDPRGRVVHDVPVGSSGSFSSGSVTVYASCLTTSRMSFQVFTQPGGGGSGVRAGPQAVAQRSRQRQATALRPEGRTRSVRGANW